MGICVFTCRSSSACSCTVAARALISDFNSTIVACCSSTFLCSLRNSFSIHLVVANAIGLSVIVADCQVRIHLFNFFRDQSELRYP